MNLLNIVESALTPTFLHDKNNLIAMSPVCRTLKNAEKFSSNKLEIWFKSFFLNDSNLEKMLRAIEGGTVFEGFLYSLVTGTQVQWLAKTLPVSEENSDNNQITWLQDNSGENIRATYWDLYIKMNEAIFLVQKSLDERSEALVRAESAEQKALFLSSLAEINPSPIMRINQQIDMVYANKPAQELISYWKDNLQQDLPEELRGKIKNTFTTEKNDTYEYTYQEKILLFYLSNTHLEDNYIDIFAMDITEKNQLEKDNLQKIALIDHAGRLAALGEMATGVAHELNQPLCIIQTNLQTLDLMGANGLPPQEAESIISSSLKQIDRATHIIDHMRSFARLETPRAGPVDLIKPITSALTMFNEQFRLHEIEIVLDLEKNIPLFSISEQQMEQLVVNLLSNARYAVQKIGKKHKRIELILKFLPAEKNILFQIRDNGIGMTPDELQACFNPFFTTKPVGEGTGLGLSIIHNIITNIKGTISIKSQLNEGTTVDILFPVALPLTKESGNISDNT